MAQSRPISQRRGADYRSGADQRTGADFGLGSNHGQRIDGDTRFESGGGMDARIRGAAGRFEQRGRPQRRRKEGARDCDKSAIRLRRDQHGERLRSLRRKARRSEADAGARRRQRIEIFLIVEKGDVARPSSIERRNVTNAPIERRVRPRRGAGELGDLFDRQRVVGGEEIRHGFGPGKERGA